MRIAVGADHGGYSLKELLVAWLRASGHEVDDLGAKELVPDDDYPDFALPVARGGAVGQSGAGDHSVR